MIKITCSLFRILEDFRNTLNYEKMLKEGLDVLWEVADQVYLLLQKELHRLSQKSNVWGIVGMSIFVKRCEVIFLGVVSICICGCTAILSCDRLSLLACVLQWYTPCESPLAACCIQENGIVSRPQRNLVCYDEYFLFPQDVNHVFI